MTGTCVRLVIPVQTAKRRRSAKDGGFLLWWRRQAVSAHTFNAQHNPRPALSAARDAVLELIVKAIKSAGLKPGADVAIALDCAASELWKGKGRYVFKKVKKKKK